MNDSSNVTKISHLFDDIAHVTQQGWKWAQDVPQLYGIILSFAQERNALLSVMLDLEYSEK